MEDVDELPERKRDRFRRRFMRVPLAVRTSDLPRRLASALVMLAVAGLALWAGGIWLDLFVAAVALVCMFEFAMLIRRASRSPAGRVAGWLAGAVYIGLGAAMMIGFGDFLLVMVLGVTIFTDTGAYFAGRTFGGPKIAPSISPSKTWAGLFGGMLGAALWVVVWVLTIERGADWISPRFELGLNLSANNVLLLVAIGAVLAVVAQVGDFFESWLKRRAGVKDSSNLIPGHGGVFDRVDGMLPVALVVGMAASLAVH